MAKLGDIISDLDNAHRYFTGNKELLLDMAQRDGLPGRCAAYALSVLELYKTDRLVCIDRHGRGIRLGVAFCEQPVDQLLLRWVNERKVLSDAEGKDITEPVDNADIKPEEFDEEARELFLARLEE